MKKSLIALAALATVATAAQAQSVTLYGIVDSGYLNVSKTGSTAGASSGSLNAIASGPLSTSRWGLKGSEDLGGGLKANFLLESEFASDTGSIGSDPLFKRGSWVQLENTSGSVTLGRQNRLDYAAVASNDPFGAANVGGFVSAGYLGGKAVLAADIRPDNAVTVQTAKINGLSVAYQLGFGEVAGGTSKSRVQSANVDYTVGKFRANYTYSQKNDAANGSGSTKGNFLFASYDFGLVKPHYGYVETTVVGSSAGIKNKVNMYGLSAPVNAKVTVMAGYYDHKNAGHADGKDGQSYSAGALYALSKRTTLYALYAKSDVDSGTVLAVANLGSQHNQATNVPSGVNQQVYAVGIRHSF